MAPIGIDQNGTAGLTITDPCRVSNLLLHVYIHTSVCWRWSDSWPSGPYPGIHVFIVKDKSFMKQGNCSVIIICILSGIGWLAIYTSEFDLKYWMWHGARCFPPCTKIQGRGLINSKKVEKQRVSLRTYAHANCICNCYRCRRVMPSALVTAPMQYKIALSGVSPLIYKWSGLSFGGGARDEFGRSHGMSVCP